MRCATVVLLSIVSQPLAFGQDRVADVSRRDSAIRDLLEELRESQPPKWSYSELAANSDLIVIATLKSQSDVQWKDEIGGSFDSETTTIVANRLQVLSVLKGHAGGEIELLTIKWKAMVAVFVNHDFAKLCDRVVLPGLVRVIKEGQTVAYADSNPNTMHSVVPEYLLYLRKVNEGQYVPVTGQRFSGMSVRTLND
jgi:hypothetical protein